MTKEKEEKILLVAKYIIENKSTISVTAKKFNISESSIKKYINDEDNLRSIKDADGNQIGQYIYSQVKKVQAELEQLGRVVGGINGIREKSHTEFEILEIAEDMISNYMTLSEASEKYSIAKSTLFESLKSINNPELQNDLDMLFSANRRKSNIK